MLFNSTESLTEKTNSTTMIWCLLMPIIHLFSLFSNLICIIIFCSKTFIHKPIAIYFIGLLISDSATLLIGYTEMLDREPHMIDSSSILCRFNEKFVHSLTDSIYTFMERYCLEWMLYKILWTRASTILLAILSVQRTRTFFSLSYRESRLCAILACLASILLALLLTCFEWIGIQCQPSTDLTIYSDIWQKILRKKSSRDFYSSWLSTSTSNQTIEMYSCLRQSIETSSMNLQFNQNCTRENITNEFYFLTQQFLSHRDSKISDEITAILNDIYQQYLSDSNSSSFLSNLSEVKSTDFLVKLFEYRSCQITLIYSICLRFFNFFHSLSFGFNRHTLAIFFGNAFPSFIVFMANLMSIKVIYCSKGLKYFQGSRRKTRRQRRLKNDLRAFLVILIESFSVITISWGIPIFLTMFHCRTLYVVSISECPKIKNSLAIFLFTDLFNSSTNSLLYSLSGKLFRRKFLEMIRLIFTCGRVQQCSFLSNHRRLPLVSHPLDSPSSTNLQNGLQSRRESSRRSDYLISFQTRKIPLVTQPKLSDDDRRDDESSLTMSFNSETKRRENHRSMKSFVLDKIRSITSRRSNETILQEKILLNRLKNEEQIPNGRDSLSSSSIIANQCVRNYSSTQIILSNHRTNSPVTKVMLLENITSI